MPVLPQPAKVSLEAILLAVDFTFSSGRAALYAKKLALRYSSLVEIIHVFDRSIVDHHDEVLAGTTAVQQRVHRAEQLERLKADFASAGIRAKVAARVGHRPHAVLLKSAEDDHVDLIVAGTAAKSGTERLVLGSTAEELIRSARCPVLTVGPRVPEPEEGPLRFRDIVVATDFSAEAAKAIEFALSFAQDSGAHIYVCHVVLPQVTAGAGKSMDRAFHSALERLIPESCRELCRPVCVIEHGDAGRGVLDLAKRLKADLIVLGARKASFWLMRIEHGLTPDLLAEATCPVLTVS